jgi:uncharacterized protein (DUF1697 family)
MQNKPYGMRSNQYAVFLRGVNVGGNVSISMETLKSLLIKNNYGNVTSYINSGNIVVTSPDPVGKVREHIGMLIKKEFGRPVEIFVKTFEDLKRILENDRFDPEKENENARKIAILLSAKIGSSQVAKLTEKDTFEVSFYHIGDTLYVYYPNGMGKSKFTTQFIEKKLQVKATARNWNTLLKMMNMMTHNGVNPGNYQLPA